MQAFYLSRNQHGYFRVRFPDPVTGKLGKAKSTHTKNRQQATLIADEWCRNGVPAGRSCERSLSVVNSGVDLVALKEKFEPDRTIVAIDGKTMCDLNKVREQLCFLHLSILKSLTVIRDSFNVIFPLFVYLWGL